MNDGHGLDRTRVERATTGEFSPGLVSKLSAC